jgi:hypothetical protein
MGEGCRCEVQYWRPSLTDMFKKLQASKFGRQSVWAEERLAWHLCILVLDGICACAVGAATQQCLPAAPLTAVDEW